MLYRLYRCLLLPRVVFPPAGAFAILRLLMITKSTKLAPILSRLAESGALYNHERIQHAYAFAKESYAHRLHWTGQTVLEHVLGTLEELVPFQPDEDTVVACLLHHVLSEKVLTLAELEEQFGHSVRSIVSGAHLLSHVTLEGRRRSIEDLRIMLLSVSDDIRILFVCLCDRANCLQFVKTIDPAMAKSLCQDVLQLFAPVAARLGIYSLKHKLESRAFPVVHPVDSKRIAEQMRRVHREHPQYLKKATLVLETFLAEQSIDARVDGREKQLFSIFHKMRSKSLTHVEDIHDLFALRVVVNTEEDCYRVLGLLHRLGRPLPHRFKDYIAFPKPNGYQSLHTTLAGLSGLPEGCFMEVQIRTERMHLEAQYGVAAHWSYKEAGATERAMEKVQLHSMLLSQQAIDSHDEQSFADHIFVLTPQGDIIELPEGATPLDFAFTVHTDLGLSFRSARVNGSIVPLDYELENGDVVEIQKHSVPHPSSQWMQMLKMGSSRSKLRRYLYAQNRPHLVAMGRTSVNIELQKRGLPKLTTDLSLLRNYDGRQLTMEQREDLLMKIGQGSDRVGALMQRLDQLHVQSQEPASTKKPIGRLQRKDALIGMEGGVPMPLRYAKCCHPQEWPHEDIAGNVNRSGEVMVHRKGCGMFANTNPERRVRLWWK